MESNKLFTQCEKKGSKYVNKWGEWPHGYFSGIPKFISWSLSIASNMVFGSKDLDKILIMKPYFINDENKFNDNCNIKATWLGHASILLEIEGVRILCDPIFSDICGPGIGVSRYCKAPCSIKDLPKIDVVVISHNHYDHMDKETLNNLSSEQRDIIWLIPDGDKKNIKTMLVKVNDEKIKEMKWWDEYKLDKCGEMTIAFTPTQHWSNRGIFDFCKSLWGSWAFIGTKTRFWFGGDTGYCGAFKEIGEKYGPFDGAAIPIGAYKPRNLLKFQHVDPEEAVKIHEDIRSKVSFGIHWGTFAMSQESTLDPKTDLENIITEKNKFCENSKEKTQFITINHGETLIIDNDGGHSVISGDMKNNISQ